MTLEHIPEDMTATVDAAAFLSGLQAALANRGQFLPVDPPEPEQLTIEKLLATNASGPRRFGYGTVRDYLIGMEIKLADGRVIKAGGKVVKNVAGYDLQKLFIGSGGALGTINEATFKLRPVPEAEQFVRFRCKSLHDASKVIESVFDSPVTPVVFDLHAPSILVLGFAGTREEVDWQLAQARELGFSESGDLDYARAFWRQTEAVHKISVLPSRLIESVSALGNVPFVARAGNGIVYYRGGPQPATVNLPTHLFKRVKDAFDPNHLLVDLPS